MWPTVARRPAPLGSVRARTTLTASLVVAAALAVSAAGVLLTLRYSLERAGDDVAQTRLHDLAVLASADALPPTLAASGEDDVAQVVDDSAEVVAATSNYLGYPAIADFVPDGDEPEVRTVTGVPHDDEFEDYRVWAVNAETARGPLTVYVATSLESVSEAMEAVRTGLVIVVPPLLAVLALITWIMLGRALRPVEAIRAEVADITDHALDRRVPVPTSRDEIGRLAETMNAMLDRLEAASERQRVFVGDASHELQSPLASVRAQLEVALAHPAKADWPAVAADMLADTQRMERLVRDLLFLARTDDSRAPSPKRLLDLDDITLDEVTRMRATTGVRVDTSRVSAAPVRGNRDELTRLTRNLLENAVRHAASAVRVELSSHNSGVRLVVQDDGPGVPPQLRRRIFDRFMRIDDARDRDHGGTGLGLAIVKGIVERHGGFIKVEDSDPGTRFVVELPQQPSAPTAPNVRGPDHDPP